MISVPSFLGASLVSPATIAGHKSGVQYKNESIVVHNRQITLLVVLVCGGCPEECQDAVTAPDCTT
jgi:hypothetical protein